MMGVMDCEAILIHIHEGSYVLIGRQGALCGNVNHVDGKNYISEHAIAVQPLGDIHWLKYKLDFWNLNKFSESSAQPGLSVEKLIRYKLTVPSIEEQWRIAEVLGCWDEAIERQGRMVSLLTTRKRALMQRLLTPQPHWQKTKLSKYLAHKNIPVNFIRLKYTFLPKY